MDIEKVRELVKLVEDSGIEELEVAHKDTTIHIQKSPHVSVGAAAVGSWRSARKRSRHPGRRVLASGSSPDCLASSATRMAAPRARR